jgi:hypothetical protein
VLRSGFLKTVPLKIKMQTRKLSLLKCWWKPSLLLLSSVLNQIKDEPLKTASMISFAVTIKEIIRWH